MEIQFDQGERAALARQLGVDPNNEAALSAAVAAVLERRERDPGDMSDIDAATTDPAERLRLKQARIAAAAASRRREYVPSDADERGFELDDDSYPENWLTAAEQRQVEERRLAERAAAQRRGGSSIIGFQPKPQPTRPQAGRVTYGQGKVTYPTGKRR